MRGYGSTDSPEDVSSFSCVSIGQDMLALLDALGEQSAILVGHDWGAILTWQLGLLHPSRFTALCAMSVPPILFDSPVPPTQGMRAASGENFMYILYHNEVFTWSGNHGVAEMEYDAHSEHMLRQMYFMGPASSVASLQTTPPTVTDPRRSAGGNRGRAPLRHGFPEWCSEEEFAYYVAEFEVPHPPPSSPLAR